MCIKQNEGKCNLFCENMVGDLDRLFSGPNPGRGCGTWIEEIQGSVGGIASLQRFPNRFSGGLVGLGRETAVFYR
jgi:hypothetical protein